SGDERVGVSIVKKSLVEPLRWIAENGGEQGYVIAYKVAELPVGQGYNAATGEYGDLVAAGVIDPVKVTRSALANAASIASLLLTRETVVGDRPGEAGAPAAAGHAHGPAGRSTAKGLGPSPTITSGRPGALSRPPPRGHPPRRSRGVSWLW